MDVLKEQLMYDTNILICFRDIENPYDAIRLILAYPNKKVSICTHDLSNTYVIDILQKMQITFVQCWTPEVLVPEPVHPLPAKLPIEHPPPHPHSESEL